MLTRNAKWPLCISSRQTPPDPAWHDASIRIGGRSPVTDGRWCSDKSWKVSHSSHDETGRAANSKSSRYSFTQILL